MARIRSIKPEFWTDGGTRRLSDTGALFFIALWNHCDDAGYFVTDTLELSMKLARWRSQDVMRLLSALHRAGMVELSACHGVGKVTSWHHQKIDKPRQSKFKDVEIQWDNVPSPANNLDESANVRRKDRIGEDRIGSDLPSAGVVERPPSAEVIEIIPKPDRAANKKIWEAFREAYFARYQVEPVRNAKVNSNIAQFAARVGAEDGPGIAKFYVGHNDSFYVRNMHAFSLCLRDAESLRTQWLKGRAITQNDVRRFEKNQEQSDLLAAIDRGEV